MILIDGKPQVQEFQLSVIAIEQIATRRTVFPGASHILTQPVEGCAFLTVSLGVFTVTLADVVLEGSDPVDLIGLLQRTRDHGRLNHLAGQKERDAPM